MSAAPQTICPLGDKLILAVGELSGNVWLTSMNRFPRSAGFPENRLQPPNGYAVGKGVFTADGRVIERGSHKQFRHRSRPQSMRISVVTPAGGSITIRRGSCRMVITPCSSACSVAVQSSSPTTTDWPARDWSLDAAGRIDGGHLRHTGPCH